MVIIKNIKKGDYISQVTVNPITGVRTVNYRLPIKALMTFGNSKLMKLEKGPQILMRFLFLN